MTVNDDALQGMLFGATSAGDETTEDSPVDELRVCALNVNSPNPSRAQRIVNWLLEGLGRRSRQDRVKFHAASPESRVRVSSAVW